MRPNINYSTLLAVSFWFWLSK